MVITYYGGEFVKIQQGDLVIAVNPISKESKLKAAKFGADIVLVGNQNNPDYNGVEQVKYGDRERFVVTGPGEYEIRDTAIKGFASEAARAGTKRLYILYSIELDGVRLVFLSGLQNIELDQRTREALSDIDILFVPVGGDEVVGPSDAYKLAVSLEARIIVPTHFDGTSKVLETFLKEGGSEGTKAVEKLTVKKKDVIAKEGEIVVLKTL